MNPIWFSFLAIFAFLIFTDSSLSKAFDLLIQYVSIQYRRWKWIILNSPDNPINRWLIHRRSMKMAKDLMKELNNGKDSSKS